MTKVPDRAAIYCRISRDPEGLRAGVERQEEDCRALAEKAGLRVTAVYIDNDIGASTLSRKPRPRFGEMLDAARAGEFQHVLAYSNSRLTRRPRELEDLIDLHDRHGVRFHTVVSGSDDLSTADGRMVARIKANVDAAEAERAGERIKRAFRQKAERGGTAQGGRPFGWQADKLTLDPTEAALIRQAVADVLDGIGLNAIVRAWNAAGVRTARGNEWDHRALRQLLRGPRLAGWRVHQGKVLRDATGSPVRGVWEPLLDVDTYDRLQVALTGRPGRSGGRRGARKYLLSGVARCGVCGRRLYGSAVPRANGPSHDYVCRGNGHTVSIAGPPTDEAVSAVVTAALHDEDDLSAPEQTPTFAGAARLAEIPGLIREYLAAHNDGTLSASVAFGQVAALEAEAEQLAAEREAFIAETASAGRPADPDNFDPDDTDRARAIIERMLTAVVIAPSRRGKRWDADRITYAWRTS